VLEALASGRRVVATRVGGIPDVLGNPELGELIPPDDEVALSSALLRALEKPYDPQRVSALAGSLDWDASARALLRVLARARTAGRSQLQPFDGARSRSTLREWFHGVAAH
jgi:glycosyltransferase involved in cell wall biosynthesis